MLLCTPAFVGFSTLLVLAVISPLASCYKPFHICLHPPPHDDICESEHHHQNLESECLRNSPLMTTFTPKNKKYIYEPISIIYEPYFAREPEVSLPTIPPCPEEDFRDIFKIPSAEKGLAHVEDGTIRHVPVVQKVTRNVVECRTRHVPVIRHRLRTVEEKYTEHVPVTQTITRPVVDTIVKQVPVFEPKKRVHRQRIKPIPTEQRVVNELLKLRQNPMYRQGTFGLSCLYPQLYNRAYSPYGKIMPMMLEPKQ